MIRLSRRSLWLALGLWAASLGQVQAADPATDLAALGAQDDRGRPVARVQAPQRIVSLLPSLTETVCALGACDRLVGVDRYSNWPEDLQRRLPVLGGGLDPNVEAIVALKPDVVLLSNSARVVERLEALGLRTVALEPRTQADVQRVLHSVGHLLRLPPVMAPPDVTIAQAARAAGLEAETVADVEEGLRRALAGDELRVQYQPVLDLAVKGTGKTVIEAVRTSINPKVIEGLFAGDFVHGIDEQHLALVLGGLVGAERDDHGLHRAVVEEPCAEPQDALDEV